MQAFKSPESLDGGARNPTKDSGAETGAALKVGGSSSGSPIYVMHCLIESCDYEGPVLACEIEVASYLLHLTLASPSRWRNLFFKIAQIVLKSIDFRFQCLALYELAISTFEQLTKNRSVFSLRM